MAAFGSFRWGASKACAIDPSAASRTFFMRGDGVAGAKPTTDELGNAVTFNGSAALASSPKYWPDYSTATRIPGSGNVALPVTAFDQGFGGTPFSILLRLAVLGGTGGQIILQNGAGAGSWGPGGIQYHLWASTGGGLNWQWYGSSSPSNIFIGGDWTAGAMHEWLITYDGTTTRGYFDGSLSASSTGTYVKVSGSTCRLGQDVAGGQQANIAVNDLTVYNSVALTTASSYTLPTLPPC